MLPSKSVLSKIMERLGKNQGCYCGEIIDIEAVLEEALTQAIRHGWQADWLPVTPREKLIALRRSPVKPARRIYLSAGIHGDEPAGPVALSQLLAENEWPDDAGLYVCPCLHPAAFPFNRRLSAEEIDLNRDYRHVRSNEVRAHIHWLEQQPLFDLTLCLHEDWEANGFYVYELNPEDQPSLATDIIAAVSEVCPIDNADLIDGREAHGGIIRPNLDLTARLEWAEAIYLIQHKTRLSYTLEAPSDFKLTTRVAALVAAAKAAMG